MTGSCRSVDKNSLYGPFTQLTFGSVIYVYNSEEDM